MGNRKWLKKKRFFINELGKNIRVVLFSYIYRGIFATIFDGRLKRPICVLNFGSATQASETLRSKYITVLWQDISKDKGKLMSTSVTNRFTISGNVKVQNFVKELNEQFINDEGGEAIVRRILYSHTLEDAVRLSRNENNKSVNYLDETNWRPIENCISFTSRSNSIEEIQDYLLITLSRLDSMVIICNQYFSDYLNGITTRYSLMNDLFPASIKIYTEVKVPNVETEAFYRKFDKIALKQKEKTFKLLTKNYPWITDDRYV